VFDNVKFDLGRCNRLLLWRRQSAVPGFYCEYINRVYPCIHVSWCIYIIQEVIEVHSVIASLLLSLCLSVCLSSVR
jgi:hypothetical protein